MIFRWGHFADLHLRFDGFTTQDLRDKLIEELEKHKLHAILIAGDLYHRGQITDGDEREICTLVHAMASSAKCDPENIFICPGNHDLPRSHFRANTLASIIRAYEQPEEANREYGLNTNGYEPIIHQQVCQPFQHTVNAIRNEDVEPILHKVYPTEFANIIVLNTAIFAGQTYPGQQGGPGSSAEDTALYIADSYLSRLRQEVRQAGLHRGSKLNIVLAHHGTGCFVRKEFHKLATVLDDMGVDLYLCGHVHQNHHQIITHTNYIPQISCGGLFEDGYNSPTFLIGEFNIESKQVKITAYEFSQVSSSWVASTAFPRPWKASSLTFTPKRLEITAQVQPRRLSMRQRLEEDILQKCPDENSSFAFTKLVKDFLASQAENSSLGSQLLDILRADILLGPNHVAISYKSLHTVALDFVAYYCLAYHYKQTDRVTGKDSLQSLVDAYGELFQSQLLSNEVQAWLARRTDRLDKAYECDCKMIEHTTVDHNAAVFVSYASTICTLMDREDHNGADSFWATPEDRTRDLERALSFMPEITGNYQKTYGTDRGYPKHFYLWTRLLFYKFLFVPMTPAARASTIAQMSDIAKGYRDCTGALDDVD